MVSREAYRLVGGASGSSGAPETGGKGSRESQRPFRGRPPVNDLRHILGCDPELSGALGFDGSGGLVVDERLEAGV
jgi:hypothetical protein